MIEVSSSWSSINYYLWEVNNIQKTMRYSILFMGLALSGSLCLEAQTREELRSPNGKLRMEVYLNSKGQAEYNLTKGKTSIIRGGQLGLVTRSGQNLSTELRRSGKASRRAIDSIYMMPWGENKRNRDNFREMSLPYKTTDGSTLRLVCRLYDEGMAIRYAYEGAKSDSVMIMDELTTFPLVGRGIKTWSIPAHNDTYELDYRTLPLDSLQDANTPMTMELNPRLWASIHEAALTDYPEMTLKHQKDGVLKAEYTAPWQDGVMARMGSKFVTPWRSVIVGEKAIDLVRYSAMWQHLNEPSRIKDTSWIKPLRYVGVWWGMHVGIQSWTIGERHGATTENAIKHIDFAAKHGIEGVLYEGWNEGWETWGGEQKLNFMKPYADFDLDSIRRHAKRMGVKLMNHHETGGNVPYYESILDSALRWSVKNDMQYLKTGYAGGYTNGEKHHGQYAVRHYRKVVETAAKYGIMVNAHEPIKDTGIRRTWPNMMTREGAKGMEWNAWSVGNSPEHHSTLVFTRLLSGPMDYTPGVFDILHSNTKSSPLYRNWNGEKEGTSRVNTTKAGQIAAWVVLYSPWQMASDLPEHYEGDPAFRFFVDYRADIDESTPLWGYPGREYAVVRRSGDRYFLGAITGRDAYTTPRLKLSFLKPGKKYEAIIYKDGKDAEWVKNPLPVDISKRVVTRDSLLEPQELKASGGMAISFIPLP